MTNERETVIVDKENFLVLCRTMYILIDKSVEDKDQKEKHFELVDKATEELQEVES